MSDSTPPTRPPFRPGAGDEAELEPPVPPRSDRFSALAVVGFVFAFLLSLIGLIISTAAYVRIKRRGLRGEGLAKAGITLGVVFTLLWIGLIVIIVTAHRAAGS
ncbi:MAG: DUF4190 domain-containing protein [Microbacteriaceae bacterium]|nr:DUF4190 domain-containing protein [Microbacteriaceae bacterium]MCL2795738.1 DUF4190 domain-containing protein [Microbacteriaceae bacterium]